MQSRAPVLQTLRRKVQSGCKDLSAFVIIRPMLTADFNANGSLRRFACGGISLNLFVGSEMEGGPTNIYLRRLGRDPAQIPLLGPNSLGPAADWHGIRYS